MAKNWEIPVLYDDASVAIKGSEAHFWKPLSYKKRLSVVHREKGMLQLQKRNEINEFMVIFFFIYNYQVVTNPPWPLDKFKRVLVEAWTYS